MDKAASRIRLRYYMVKSHDKFGFDEAKNAHFYANPCNPLNPIPLHLHTQNSQKTHNRFCF